MHGFTYRFIWCLTPLSTILIFIVNSIHIALLHLLYFQSEYFITFHWIFSKSNMTDSTSGAGLSAIPEYPSFPPDFNGLEFFIVFNYML